ncbi:hypothetical protein LXL04_037224 [Taraxacum kok-saghyz]
MTPEVSRLTVGSLKRNFQAKTLTLAGTYGFHRVAIRSQSRVTASIALLAEATVKHWSDYKAHTHVSGILERDTVLITSRNSKNWTISSPPQHRTPHLLVAPITHLTAPIKVQPEDPVKSDLESNIAFPHIMPKQHGRPITYPTHTFIKQVDPLFHQLICRLHNTTPRAKRSPPLLEVPPEALISSCSYPKPVPPQLAEYKGGQNWITVDKEKFKFPGVGSQFIHGTADQYINQISQVSFFIAWSWSMEAGAIDGGRSGRVGLWRRGHILVYRNNLIKILQYYAEFTNFIPTKKHN